MPDPIKVMPVSDDAVGIVHPVDGPLDAAGSLWSYDAFTVRHICDGVIRRFEVDADGAKPAAKKPATAPTP